MTQDNQELLRLFGRLFRQRGFVQSAIWNLRTANQDNEERGQLRLLRLVAERQPLTNSEIVEALDIRPSSASALVAKLEASGLVKREPSAEDGRVMLISLTDDGQAFIASARGEKDKLADTLFAGLSADEQAQLTTLLRKLVTSLEANDADGAADDYFKQLGPFGPHRGGRGHHPHHGWGDPRFNRPFPGSDDEAR